MIAQPEAIRGSRSMRVLFALPILFAASPALAQHAPPPPVPYEIDRALSDLAMADRLGEAMGAITRAVMALPVGEVQAAIEDRPVTRADRERRVGDMMGGPRAADRIEYEARRSGRQAQAVGRAAVQSLPAIMGALEQASGAIERAVSNLPDPTYPRR